jgi:hypothetical protein
LPALVFRVVETGQIVAGIAVADATALVVGHLGQFATSVLIVAKVLALSLAKIAGIQGIR